MTATNMFLSFGVKWDIPPWFDLKQLFKQILIFIQICPFQTWLERQTF